MQLNPDCIRAILLSVEEYTGFKKIMNIDEKHYAQYPLLQEFEFDVIAYHIVQCNLSGYFLEPVQHLFPHVFSANFADACVKNPCHTTVCLRIFALSSSKLCSKIRT